MNRAAGQGTAPGRPATAPDLRVEFFGAEKGYAVGQQRVTLLCVIRNEGAPVTADTLRLRCSVMSGLDYTTGDTRPMLPALATHQAAAYRWTLAPSDAKSPLVAAVLIERAEGAPVAEGRGPRERSATSALLAEPQATLTVIPRFVSEPSNGGIPGVAGPNSRAGMTAGAAWIANDRVSARAVRAKNRQAVLFLGAKQGTAWTTLATGLPLVEVLSGEEGQLAWWETFRWRTTGTNSDAAGGARLTLNGTLGSRWRAEVVLELARDTGAIQGRVRLTARRPIRLRAVRLPRLMADTKTPNTSPRADGSARLLDSETSPLPSDSRVVALRSGEIAFGVAWGTAFPFSNWRSAPLPIGGQDLASVLGAEWRAEGNGTLLSQGASLEIPFRLFAFGPTGSVRDALRFAIP